MIAVLLVPSEKLAIVIVLLADGPPGMPAEESVAPGE